MLRVSCKTEAESHKQDYRYALVMSLLDKRIFGGRIQVASNGVEQVDLMKHEQQFAWN